MTAVHLEKAPLRRGFFVCAESAHRVAVPFPRHLPRCLSTAAWDVTPTLRQRAEAAWLWSQRGGVLSGLTAARPYGTNWIDDSLPIELIWSNGRPPSGIRVFKGFPKPLTQIPVRSGGRIKYYLDMGWVDLKIAVEYDGDHHRTGAWGAASKVR